MTTFIVTTTEDDAFDNDGTDATDVNGLSLREAIGLANANPGHDVITFDAGLIIGGTNPTITLTEGALEITDSVTIDGDFDGTNDDKADITIDGDGKFTVFNIDIGGIAPVAVTLEALNITDGYHASAGSAVTVDQGSGATDVLSSVTISNSSLFGNNASSGATVKVYAGGDNFVETTIVNSLIENNSGNQALAIYGNSQDTDNSLYRSLAIDNSTIANNSSSDTVIYVQYGTNFAVTNSTIFANNSARIVGSYNAADVNNSIIEVSGSGTISINEGTSSGGSTNEDALLVTGQTLLVGTSGSTDNTLSINDSYTGFGGNYAGISGYANLFTTTDGSSILSYDAEGDLVLSSNNSTVGFVSANSAAIDSLFSGETVSITGATAAPLNTAATINGTATGTVSEDSASPVTGTLTISDSDGSGEESFIAETVDVFGATTYGTLTIAANGTWTYDLDETDSTVQALAAGETLQDVQTVRSVDGTTQDITITINGADEAPLVVTTLSDQAAGSTDLATETADDGGLSLREALVIANANGAVDTITFDAGLAGGTLILTEGELVISEGVTIDGDTDGDNFADITISGNNASRIFNIDLGTDPGTEVTLESLTIENGYAVGAGGGILVTGTGNFDIAYSSITDNHVEDTGDQAEGGGLRVEDLTGYVTISNSSFTGNTTDLSTFGAREGGAVSAHNVTGDVTVSDSTFTQNYAVYGGAIDVENVGALRVTGSTIANNSAYYGGGIQAVLPGNIVVNDTTFAGNYSGNYGSALYVGGSGSATVSLMDNIIVGASDTDETIWRSGFTNLTLNLSGTNLIIGTVFNLPPTNVDADFTPASMSDLGDIFDETTAVNFDASNIYSGFLPSYTVYSGVLSDSGRVGQTIALENGGAADGTGVNGGDVGAGPVDVLALVDGPTEGAITEGNIGDAAVTAGGTLTITDADIDDTPSFADVASTAGDNGYGSFVLTSSTWTYTLDQSAVQHLNAGDQVTDTITFTATDGTTQEITVTIDGTSDAASSFGGTLSGTIGENGDTVGGTATVSDVDNTDNSFIVETVDGTYGSLSMAANGTWTYDVDETHSTVQALNEGDTLGDTVTIRSEDGTTQQISITIDGANDAASFGGDLSGFIGEDGDTISGTATVSDVDSDETFVADTLSGAYGELTIDAGGNWSYDLNEAESTVQALNVGDTLDDTFNIQSADGTKQEVVITIDGANDAPVVTLPSAPTVTEDGTAIAIADDIQIADVDGNDQTVTLTITGGTASLGTTTGLTGLTGDGTSSISFTGSLADANAALDSLNFTPTADLAGVAAGAIRIQTSDGNGGDDEETVTFDIGAAADTLVVTTASDSGDDLSIAGSLAADTADGDGLSLREAIAHASDLDTVTFDLDQGTAGAQGGTIDLTGSAGLTISQNITIDGDVDGDDVADVTIDGDGFADRLIHINNGAAVTLNSLTLANATSSNYGAAILVTGVGTDLTLNDSRLTGNEAAYGGAIAVSGVSNELVINNSLIDQNISTQAAAVHFRSSGFSSLSINNSTIAFNRGTHDVGGVWAVDTNAVSITDSTIVGNYGIYGSNDVRFGSISSLPTITDSIIGSSHDGASIASSGSITFSGTNLLSEAFGSVSDATALSDIFGPNFAGYMSDSADLRIVSGETTPVLLVSPTGPAVSGGSVIAGAAPANVAPQDILLSNQSVDENDSDAVIGTLSATDPEGDAITFSVVGDSRFEVSGTTLQLASGQSLDFEGENGNVTVTVRATDALGSSTDQDFTIGINDIGSVLTGDDANNSLTGTDENDTISGAGGNDTLIGNDGGDSIRGGDGNDILFANGGDDTLHGDDGDDSLTGGDGIDRLYGGDGDDTLTRNGEEGGILSGDAGDDLLIGGDSRDLLYGGEDNDVILAGGGNDSVVGGAGDDSLVGGDGNDRIAADVGADTVIGGAGNDTLIGQADAGDGRDVYVLDLESNDRIERFDASEDVIRVPRGVSFADFSIVQDTNAGGTGFITYDVSYVGADAAYQGTDLVITVLSGTGVLTESNFINVNDLPTSADDTISVDEDGTYSFDGSEFAFTDTDGDSLSHIRIDTVPANGTLVLDGTALAANDTVAAADLDDLSFTPNADYNGSDSFTFTVNDGVNGDLGFAESSNTIAITINPIDDPAIFDTANSTFSDTVSETANDTETPTVSGALALTDIDGGSDSIVGVASVAGDNGFGSFSFDSSSGEWTYMLDQSTLGSLDTGETATDTTTFTTSNGVQQQVTVTINGLNESQTFVVTTADDVVDDTDGVLSLREALTLANAEAQADTITFDASLAGETITLTGGQLVISENVMIDGDFDGSGDNKADITISGNDSSRVFDITNSSVVTLDALHLTEGSVSGGNSSGGAVQAGFGTNLHIANSTISDSYAGYRGGAVFLGGSDATTDVLTITNSLIVGNEATSGGGVVAAYTNDQDSLLISGTTITQNVSQYYHGGGVTVYSGGGIDVDIDGSTISGNVNTQASSPGEDGFSDELHLMGANVEISDSIIGSENTSAAPNISLSGVGNYSATFTGPVVLTEATAYSISGDTTVGISSLFGGSGNAIISTAANFFAQTGMSTLTDRDGNSADVITGVLTDNGGVVDGMTVLFGGDADDEGTNGGVIGAGPVGPAAAVIGGTTTASVAEDETGTVSGTLTISDGNGAAEESFTAETINGTYGDLTIDADGSWSYDLSEAESTVQALNTGDSLQDTLTVSSADGTTQDIILTINGANDAASIAGDLSGAISEDGDTIGGTATATDVDNTDNSFIAEMITGTHGSLAMAANGTWTYDLDEADSAVQALNAGDTLGDTFSIRSADGTTQDIVITINGANDAASFGGDLAGTIGEDGDTISGTATVTDVDNADNSFIAETVTGTHGSLTIAANGTWTYDLDEADNSVQALNAGDTLGDTVSIRSADGTTQDIAITIDGANDAANFAGDLSGAIGEDDDTIGGTVTATDVDNTDNLFTAETVAGTYGSLTIDSSGAWTYTLDGTNPLVQALDAGDTLADTVTIQSEDGTSQDIGITISGVNNVPDAVADNVTSSEEGTVFFNVLTNDSDPEGAALSIESIDTSGVSGGVVTMLDASTGAFSFDPDDAFDGLFEGEQQTVSFSYTVTDGESSSTANVTITVNGEGTLIATMQDVDENDEGATVGQLSSATGFPALAAGSGDVFTTSDSRFEVSEDGVISLVDGVSLDYETETSVDFTITRTRGSDGVVEDIDVTVTVDDVAAGSAQDGYIANALVFIDTDGDGVYDAGTDPATVTDAGGNFELPQGVSGTLILQGGINPITSIQAVDISTGLDFNGTLTAPSGSTVVTPVTTLIHAIAGEGASSAQIASAESQVSTALGINDAVELTTFDPINAALNGDANGTDVHAAGTQVLNTVVLTGAAVEGAGGTDGDAAAFGALADTVENASGALDLGDTAVVSSVITNAGTQAGADAGVVTTAANSTAAIIADTNTAVDTAVSGASDALDALTGVTQTAIVAQGDAASDLETAVTAAAGGDTSQLATAETDYTDASLTTAVDNATVGTIEPGRVFTGTSAAETLTGAGGDDTLRGLGGDDTLDGEAGIDRFVMDGSSSDTILNFDTSSEVIDLTATNTYGLDFSGTGGSLVIGDGVSESGGNLLITLGNGQTLTLDGTTASNVTSANFAFATNTAPTGADNTLTVSEDAPYALTAADFGYSDADGDALSAVRIDSLPTGTLTLNGSDVTAGQEIDVVDIASGLLVFTPAADANGIGLTSFTFSVGDGTDFAAAGSVVTFDVTNTNDAPTASDNTISMDEGTTRILTGADFNFADIDSGDTLQSVRFDSVTVSSGTFQLSGADVNSGDVIAVADIAAGNLVYTPAGDAFGDGLLSVTFSVSDGAAFAATSSTLNIDVDEETQATSSGSGSGGSSGGSGNSNTQIIIEESDSDTERNTVEGSAQDDRINVGGGDDIVNGDDGADEIEGASGADILRGGNGNDTLDGGSGADTLRGDAGDDRIAGGEGDDIVWAGPDDAGADTIEGNAGDDVIGAGTGDDLIVGGDANASVTASNFSAAGSDTLFGGEGNDIIVAGSYNTSSNTPVLNGTGNNIIWAGTGNDTVFGDGEDDIMGGGAGNDVLQGGAGSDLLYGGRGSTEENDDILSGGDGADFVFASAGDDTVNGGAGNDELFGGIGDDTVNGGEGNDDLFGGSGNDLLSGGVGSDVFYFAGNHGTDTISDFDVTEDTLFLANAVTDFTGFSDIVAAASESVVNGVNGVLIDTGGGNSLFLQNVERDDLSESNFTL